MSSEVADQINVIVLSKLPASTPGENSFRRRRLEVLLVSSVPDAMNYEEFRGWTDEDTLAE